jgi:hypothetical protein
MINTYILERFAFNILKYIITKNNKYKIVGYIVCERTKKNGEVLKHMVNNIIDLRFFE